MPGLDRTGPLGLGPMTGGARGLCNPYYPLWRSYGYFRPFGFRRGFWGIGFGRGGRGWRHWFYATGLPGWARAGVGYPFYPISPPLSKEDEVAFLKNEQELLKQQLEQINSRLNELEKEKE